ncbi:MAG: hypothetical protein ABI592_08505 [Acidobacteriota bacterium]
MRRLFIGIVAILAASTTVAQINTTIVTSVNLAWGQKVLTTMGPSAATAHWFHVFGIAGRSYCAETGQAETTVFAERVEDSDIEIQDDTGTPIAFNDDPLEEPYNYFHSRACWIPTLHGFNYIRVKAHQDTPVAEYLTLRVIETTLFCPWFFVAGDYNAFSLIRNTAGRARDITVTWRGLSGVVAGTTTVTIPPNGTIVLNARNFVNPAVFSNGSVEIAHAGSPEQIQGSTTTLSGTTGLGFDAQFTQRKPW